jgi:protein-S-isoprenylcysteine O-methyltransferase Ste14
VRRRLLPRVTAAGCAAAAVHLVRDRIMEFQATIRRWVSPPVALAAAALATWWIAASTSLGRFTFAYQGWLAAALITLGVGIVVASLRLFAKAQTTPNPMHPEKATELVTSGAYRLSRNPMYVGDALMLAGLAVWLGSVAGLVILAAFVTYIDRVQIASEEAALTERFGDRYVAYRRQVRRWL